MNEPKVVEIDLMRALVTALKMEGTLFEENLQVVKIVEEQQVLIDGLMKVLFIVIENEGTLFDNQWEHYGITEDQKLLINQKYNEFYENWYEKKISE